jgi:two-component system cell cycle response regulator
MTVEATVARPCILVVDDSRLIRRSITKILGEHYELIEAADGEDGWEKLVQSNAIKMVISDLSMPRLDGFGLLNRLRTSQIQRLNDIPVIVLTGNEDDDPTRQKALAAGATDFVTKPFDGVQLLARTRSHLKLGRTSQQLTETARKLTETSTALERQALTDPITGLANRRLFQQHGNQHLSFARRHHSTLGLIRLDIDGLTALIRRHGMDIGKQILRGVAEILSAETRQEDMVAHIGIGKFGIWVPGIAVSGVQIMAQRILVRITSRQFTINGETRSVTASAGLVTPKISLGLTLEKIVVVAEQRLALAIRAGGNRLITGREQPATEVALPTAAPQPEASPDTPGAVAEPPQPLPILDIPTALKMLAQGEHQPQLISSLPNLLRQILPLLALGDEVLQLDIGESLAKLRNSLEK